ncbi:hypothetical protein BpHYR1_052282 [Brachionus plicatilis]|uniref:Uncharacterized protein n=1 Tax=Brachionus plicatilis TaxID=10195 RepID=A0A3M7S3I5_BRAPC|nr:hypothetical protein BpHYR1_052282 [Brachionus plicatilis]
MNFISYLFYQNIELVQYGASCRLNTCLPNSTYSTYILHITLFSLFNETINKSISQPTVFGSFYLQCRFDKWISSNFTWAYIFLSTKK